MRRPYTLNVAWPEKSFEPWTWPFLGTRISAGNINVPRNIYLFMFIFLMFIWEQVWDWFTLETVLNPRRQMFCHWPFKGGNHSSSHFRFVVFWLWLFLLCMVFPFQLTILDNTIFLVYCLVFCQYTIKRYMLNSVWLKFFCTFSKASFSLIVQ